MHLPKKIVAAVAAGGLLTGAAMLSGGMPAVAQPEGTLRVIAVTTEESDGVVDSVGDTFAFGGDLFAVRRGESDRSMLRHDSRRPIGRFGVSCVVTSIENSEANCSASASIDQPRRGDDGQITVQGLVTGDEPMVAPTSEPKPPKDRPKPFELAITGGTDDFDNAGGTLIVRDLSDTVELLTFRFAG